MSDARPEAEQIGAVVERLSVLIAAGVTPQDAWRYVGELHGVDSAAHSTSSAAGGVLSGPPGRRGEARASAVATVIARVVRDVEAGRPVADAIGAAGSGAGRSAAAVAADAPHRSAREREREFSPTVAWAALAAAWYIASEAGAPLAACLDDLARCLLAAGEVERDTAAALAGPVATTRMVVALPLVSIVSGAVLGLDTLRILFTTPAGIACLVAGGVLLLIARAWSARLLRRARRVEAVPGLALDLVAVAASGGGSLERAVELVDGAMRRFDIVAANDPRTVADVLRLAARAGAPPGDLLTAEALRVRRDAVGVARRRAAALDVWLMIPLGVCVLPAFVLLAVVPVIVGVISTMSLS